MPIESKSIDYVHEHERHGRVIDQGPFWFLGNFHFFTIAIGFVGPSMGLGFAATSVAGTLGILFGTIFVAFHAAQGVELGLPQMIQSRAQFGFRGVTLVLIGTLFTFVGFNVADSVLASRGLNVVDMRKIDEFGVVAPLKAILDEVRRREGVLHVSLDVDFLDPSLAPGVGTTVPGGATYREAHLIMEMLHDSGLVGSLDIVELNPFLDERGRSAHLLVDLVASLFGRRIVDRSSR